MAVVLDEPEVSPPAPDRSFDRQPESLIADVSLDPPSHFVRYTRISAPC